MRPGTSITLFAASLVWLGAIAAWPQTAAPPAEKPTADQVTFFETKIRPVLAANCFQCHGGAQKMSGLKLDTRDGFRKGGDSGPAFVAGNPDQSLIIKAIRQTGNLKMPPSGTKLNADQIKDFETWIKMGAPWPDDSAKAQLGPAPLWSLQPVKMPAIPKVKWKAWVKNPIDAFVLSKLEANKIEPAPWADRRTLLRRVSYDLTGLPPTPAETDSFLNDKAGNAYEKVVDRLLASPHYGERWARHWMDVARYADTKGYVFEEDRNYYNAYTYRDWLINAFNDNLPYDKFIEEQLAADLMPAVKDSDDKRPLAAMGYLTLGRRFINSVPDIIDDRIDVTMRGFQGFTVGCARCHDHKFDPIPTQDYYSLYAVFNDSQEETLPISDKAIRDPWAANNQKQAETEGEIRTIVQDQVRVLRKKDQNGLSKDVKGILMSVREEAIPSNDQVAKLMPAFEADQRDKLTSDIKLLDQLRKNAPPTPELAMAMVDRKNCGDGVVFKRGNPNLHGDPAPRRFLLALSKPGEERAHWTDGSGRLDLAESLASTSNPLTARVFVNRVWQDHFGAGIVRTPSDFGHQGEKPTDPQLLDCLASSFMDSGWNIKKLQKLIVMSATYCQSSEVSAKTFQADPENRLWSRMNRRRLDLEEMRDSLVDAAGDLDLAKVGGKSVDLWSEPFTNRRAMYGFVERQNLPGIFRTFDFASPDTTSPRRFFTTVPQQALFLMNSGFAVDQARSLADRSEIASSQDDAQRIRRLYRILFDRLPTADETSVGLAYLRPGSGATVRPPSAVWEYGYGGYDEGNQRVTSFTPFETFNDVGYHAGKQFPDPTLGYVLLNASGGHPGHDGAHSAIRRWVAPADMTIKISAQLAHRQAQGDGVRARIVSSRYGLLGEWKAHNSQARTDLATVTVQKGDTIDFVLDPMTNDAYDAFEWSPDLKSLDGRQEWSAKANFGPPAKAPLTRLSLYAQALMMTNEFMFVD